MLSGYRDGSPISYAADMITADLVRDYHIPPIYRHHYVNFESLRDFLVGSFNSAEDDTVLYLVILGFNGDDMVQLERRGLRNGLPKFTVLIDNNTETMIVKLMPGLAHDRSSRLMNGFLRDRLVLLGLQRLLLPAGSARIRFPTGLEKEPDEQLTPRTRNALTDYPSFVLEVGVSETLSQLRRDARLWLTNTNGRTRLVLIVALNKSRKLMRFERWENSPNVATRSTRSSTPTGTGPATTQVIEYNHTRRLLTGAPLVLPVDLLFDVVPPNIPPGEITISEQDLMDCCVDSFLWL